MAWPIMVSTNKSQFYSCMPWMDFWNWLIKHGISRHKIDKSILFLFNFINGKIPKQMRGYILDNNKRESWPVNQFPELNMFVDPRVIQWWNSQVLLEKGINKSHKFHCFSFPVLQLRNWWTLTRVTVLWGKRNNQIFQGLLDTCSELVLISVFPEN